MKKLKVILLILIANFYFAQTKQFLYEYITVPDSTEKAVHFSAIMVLNIDHEKSEYFNYEQSVSDSTIHAEIKDGSYFLKPPAPPQKRNKINIRDRVVKKSNSNTIEYLTKIAESDYLVQENIDLKWKLYPEYISVLDYKAQKATAEFGGRKWIAWFTKDIPFQDGPYKFEGLPGLIVKIEDESKSHQFQLKGIKNVNNDFIYPELNNYSKINLTYQKFIKAYKNYRESPAADLIGKILDQRDASGNFRKGSDIIREIEKKHKRRT